MTKISSSSSLPKEMLIEIGGERKNKEVKIITSTEYVHLKVKVLKCFILGELEQQNIFYKYQNLDWSTGHK